MSYASYWFIFLHLFLIWLLEARDKAIGLIWVTAKSLKNTKIFCSQSIYVYVLLTVLPSHYNSCKWTTWRTILFLYVYFNSLHVSSTLVLIIRRISCINITSGMCQSDRLLCRSGKNFLTFTLDGHQRRVTHIRWHISDVVLIQMILLMMSTRLLETVENWNKHVGKKKSCASSWSFTRRAYMCILYVCRNVKLLSPSTSTDWFLYPSWRVFTARYETGLWKETDDVSSLKG
jgi:hypothetical protein